jgi:hypothetical protein
MQPMLDRAKTGLAEPFRGIITDGGIVPGLFALEKTGISLVALLEVARSFLASLSAEQHKAACFAIDDEAWRQWSNIHPWLMRHGICLADLDGNQREAALALMREAMSAAGYQTARDVMRLNEHALEITGKPEEYGEWFYWVSFFGTPSPERPWGWQIDGHHLNVNCFVLGDQLVLTPIFMGSPRNSSRPHSTTIGGSIPPESAMTSCLRRAASVSRRCLRPMSAAFGQGIPKFAGRR